MLQKVTSEKKKKNSLQLERQWFKKKKKKKAKQEYQLCYVEKEELVGPKVLHIAPPVVSLTMSTAEKPISHCSLRGYLALTSCLPMKSYSATEKKKASEQEGDVSAPLKRWTSTVYFSRPICDLTKPQTELWQYIKGCINNNNERVIKDDCYLSLSIHKTQAAAAAAGLYSLTERVDVCSRQGAGYTHHFLVGELPSLDAATVSNGLLVPLALGVAEQVHLWGDLQIQTQRSEVSGADTMATEGRKGSAGPSVTRVKRYTTWTRTIGHKFPLLNLSLKQIMKKSTGICY